MVLHSLPSYTVLVWKLTQLQYRKVIIFSELFNVFLTRFSPQSLDPLGVIVLPSFRFNRAVDQSRKHVIRISRGPSLYLFAGLWNTFETIRTNCGVQIFSDDQIMWNVTFFFYLCHLHISFPTLPAHDEADYEHWIQSLAQAAKNNNVSIQASISNCALAALAINQPALTGWLYKLKLSGFRAKRKYCVLKVNLFISFSSQNDNVSLS